MQFSYSLATDSYSWVVESGKSGRQSKSREPDVTRARARCWRTPGSPSIDLFHGRLGRCGLGDWKGGMGGIGGIGGSDG